MKNKTQNIILLVSGISGSGKTTFIQLLGQQKMSREISQKLPEECHEWNVVDVVDKDNDLLDSELIKKLRGTKKGLIVHYDCGNATNPIRDYKNDPKLKFIDEAQKVQFVVVDAKPEQLKNQFLGRFNQEFKSNRFTQASRQWKNARATSALRRQKNQSIKSVWRYGVKPIIRSIKIIITGKQNKEMQHLKKNYAPFYDKSDLQKTALQNWMQFTQKKIKQNKYPEMIIVTADEKNLTPNFKIISDRDNYSGHDKKDPGN